MFDEQPYHALNCSHNLVLEYLLQTVTLAVLDAVDSSRMYPITFATARNFAVAVDECKAHVLTSQ